YIIAAQHQASPYAHSVWAKRGASIITEEGPSHGLWRSAHGHIVLPTSLVQVATRSAHGQDHCTSGEVLRRLQAVWWSPFFRPAFVAETIKKALKMLGIKQKFRCVYHPQSQRVVERANGMLKAKLAKIRADSQYKINWVDALPLALMAIRTLTNTNTKLRD
ncbi:hypothetical protein DVA81_17895, partial [Acinetobacter baumannii]